MPYIVKIFSADDVSDDERHRAVARFRSALVEALGDDNLVLPCFVAYRRIFEKFGQLSKPWPLTSDEQLLVDQWEAAELAATQAAFGVNRYLGDADFDIAPLP